MIEGEGSFFCRADKSRRYSYPSFSISMSDQDVIVRAQVFLNSLGVILNITDRQPKLYGSSTRKKDGQPYKHQWTLDTKRPGNLKIIIDKCYPYFSEKKQSDCDRILKNLADRGLLGDSG